MITPIRGRKHIIGEEINLSFKVLKDDNPDKGTETSFVGYAPQNQASLKDDNPDKGTETDALTRMHALISLLKDDNPDKGTETCSMCYSMRWEPVER